MKLKHLFPQRQRHQVIRQFGQAKLVKLPGGRHELIGGSATDRVVAGEWVSFFAHEIVFTHREHEAQLACRARRKAFPARPQFAL